MERWDSYLSSVSAGLNGLAVTDREGHALPLADAFSRWVEITHAVASGGGDVYFAGNGASAAMASHFAADACKNARLRSHALHEPALLTACGNDEAFTEVFALPLARLARPGDLLISISSSGASPNIVRALEYARSVPLRVVTLSGRKAENPSRRLGDLNFYVPSERYGWIESAHNIVLHYWLDQYLNAHGQGAI